MSGLYDQPDATSVADQFDRVLDALTDKFPRVAEHLDNARADVHPVHRVPQRTVAANLEQQPQRTAQP